jgi:hypothetical protein
MDVLSTENIRLGMARAPIPKQYYFIDACRSDVASMHELADASGIPALPESRVRTRGLSAPVLRASVTGDVTYQPAQPGTDAVSFFGKALLDALEVNPTADPAFAPETIPEVPMPAICFLPLYRYTLAAVKATLARYPEIPPPLTGPVSMGNVNEDPIIVAFAPPAPVAANGTSGGVLPQGPVESPESAPETPAEEAAREIPLSVEEPAMVMYSAPGQISYGPKAVSELFAGARVAQWQGFLANGASDWWPVVPTDAFEVLEVEGTPEMRWVRVHCRFRRGHWNWVELDCGADHVNSFLIPDSYDQPEPVVVFDVSLASSASDLSVVDVHANLSLRNDNPELLQAAELYRTYRQLSARNALQGLTSGPLHDSLPLDEAVVDSAVEVLRHKTESGIAATVGALVLFKGGRLQSDSTLLGWLDTLANRFPYSDAAVLGFVLEVESSRGSLDEDVIVRRITQLAENGAPFTVEGFGYLLRLIHVLFNTSGASNSIITADMQKLFPPMWHSFYARLAEVKSAYRGAGLFTNFVSTAANANRLRPVIG